MQSARSVARSATFIDQRYPLTKILTDVFLNPPKNTSARGSRRPGHASRTVDWRTEIISEKLCDDLIEYLAPTLEQHQGCTIIDVHPGACLWSSKVHDFLLPKRHVLMEPEPRYFEPFIKPLLERSGSTFRHTPLTGAHTSSYFGNYRVILDDLELLPQKAELPLDDPKLRHLDPNILVIGNLWRNYGEQRITKAVSFAPLILQHMTYAALSNEIFQRNGLVRMLWWAPDSHKAEIFAESTFTRSSFNVGLNLGASITEAAGTEPSRLVVHQPNARQRRGPIMEKTVEQSVDMRMQRAGMKPPSNRQQLAMQPRPSECLSGPNPLEPIEPCTLESLENSCQKFQAALDQALREILTKARKLDAGVMRRAYQALSYSQIVPAIKGSIDITDRSFTEVPILKITVAVDLFLQLLHLEASFAAIADTGPNVEQLDTARSRVLDLGVHLEGHLQERLASRNLHMVDVQLENLIAFYASPAIVSRDERLYEPLQVYSHEFWPQHNMTLLDVVPSKRDLALPGIASRREGVKTCQELLKYLMLYPASPVPVGLDRIAPNAAEGLIPQVPDIMDARKGGRLDPSKVKIRMLSNGMVEGLTRAFLEWPFKPTTWELALASGEDDVSSEEETERMET